MTLHKGVEVPVPEADAQLIRRARAGDLGAFDQLVERHHQRVLGLARTVVHDPDDARDTAQEAFVKAFKSLSTLRDEEAFGAWLLKLVRRLALNRARANRLRRAHRSAASPEESAAADRDAAVSPHHAYLQTEAREAATKSIRSLPPKYAAVAWLRFAEEMKVGDIARTLGLSRAATESRLRRATAQLRESLAETIPDLLKSGMISADEQSARLTDHPASEGDRPDEMSIHSQTDLQALGR